MYSRRLKIEERQNRKKATGFILLTIAFLAFMFFFGLPLIVKLSNFAYDLKKTGEPVESSDSTPPPPPHFNSFPAYTKEKNIELSGNTEAGATLTIFFNSQKTEVVAGSDGNFSHSFSLNVGENIFLAEAEDSSGNKSLQTEEYKIVYDNEPPDLQILNPKDGDEFYGTKGRQVIIQGITEKNAQVQINDRWAVVDSSGNFSYSPSLNGGENKFTVKSQDQAGNTKEASITVTYYP